MKANKGAAGVDAQSLAEFEVHLKDNLYKLWNRMSSGTYFPMPVKAVEIPKPTGGKRTLGIPTVMDRIAQTVVTMTIEADLEKIFHADSYGYRPNKGTLDGIAVTRQRCWWYEWLIEYDIRGLFDNINHEKLMKAVKKHVTGKWQLLYIERWLKVPIQDKNGVLKERNKGVPQGGVISPLLANLFLHYAIDEWMKRNHPKVQWARYADDGVIHCRTQKEAELLVRALDSRLKECDLEMHQEKTKIVYCGKAKVEANRKFTFLGYTFRPRAARIKQLGQVFTSFLPAISKEKQKAIRRVIKEGNLRNRSDLSIEAIAAIYNPKLRGWYAYFGKFYPSELEGIWEYFNRSLVSWAQGKYKSLRRSKEKAITFIGKLQEECGRLFFHWKLKNGRRIQYAY